MQWLPTYMSRTLDANKESISLTAMPYVVNSLVGVGESAVVHLFSENYEHEFSEYFYRFRRSWTFCRFPDQSQMVGTVS